MRNSAGPGETVASRIIGILECFDGFHRTATLTQIAERSGLTMPTAHRLVKELAEAGLLRRGQGGAYSLGMKMWELGCAAPDITRLQEGAMPYLQDLYEATRENVHFAIRDGHETIYVVKLSGPTSISLTTRGGRRLNWHTTGVGKAIVAFSDEEVQEEMLSVPLERLTPTTIVDPEKMRLEFARIRESGFALSQGEHETGTFSLAAPVLDRSRQPVAAVAVTLPSSRANVAQLNAAVRTVAIGITRTLVG